MDNIKSFLGTGWAFPPTFNPYSGAVEMVQDAADIEQSLQILLTTRQGERILRSDYGCNLDEMVFEPLTTTFKNYMKDLIQTAILYYEPRVVINNIELNEEEEKAGIIQIQLDYTVRSTNSRFNFVFPFYKNEATGGRID